MGSFLLIIASMVELIMLCNVSVGIHKNRGRQFQLNKTRAKFLMHQNHFELDVYLI